MPGTVSAAQATRPQISNEPIDVASANMHVPADERHLFQPRLAPAKLWPVSLLEQNRPHSGTPRVQTVPVALIGWTSPKNRRLVVLNGG
jgi:hypothetical protein